MGKVHMNKKNAIHCNFRKNNVQKKKNMRKNILENKFVTSVSVCFVQMRNNYTFTVSKPM